jgi:hypothetical protein
MDKQKAIQLIEDIQGGGSLFDRNVVPNIMRGSIAKDLWHNPYFAFGSEYGAIAAIMQCFDISEEDIRREHCGLS